MIIMMKKTHKGRRVYHTFTDMTFCVVVPAVVRFSLGIERLRVQGNVFTLVQEDLPARFIPSLHVGLISVTEERYTTCR